MRTVRVHRRREDQGQEHEHLCDADRGVGSKRRVQQRECHQADEEAREVGLRAGPARRRPSGARDDVAAVENQQVRGDDDVQAELDEDLAVDGR